MGKKIAALVLGIFFSLSLAIVGYFALILAIALAFTNKSNLFEFMPFTLWGLALVSFVASCLAIKFPKVTSIILCVPVALELFTTIYTFAQGLFNFVILAVYVVSMVLGIIPIILGFLSKPSEGPAPYVVGPVRNPNQPIAGQGQTINITIQNPTQTAPKAKVCPYCGSAVNPGDKKCESCGGKVV